MGKRLWIDLDLSILQRFLDEHGASPKVQGALNNVRAMARAENELSNQKDAIDWRSIRAELRKITKGEQQ